MHKFIDKIKDKLSKNKTNYPSVSEYAFSSEEIESMSKQNKQHIQELKQDIFSSKRQEKDTSKLGIGNDVLSPVEGQTVIDAGVDEKMIEEYQEKVEKEEEVLEEQENEEIPLEREEVEEEDKGEVVEISKEEESLKEEKKNSFIHLSPEHQRLVMEKWNEIDSSLIDKDIMEGKDLLNRNYTITYADDALEYIHHIRKCYEVVICYLIGFNNEKKGIYEKTIFSTSMDEEWKYLNNYIKVLEKIRSFRK